MSTLSFIPLGGTKDQALIALGEFERTIVRHPERRNIHPLASRRVLNGDRDLGRD